MHRLESAGPMVSMVPVVLAVWQNSTIHHRPTKERCTPKVIAGVVVVLYARSRGPTHTNVVSVPFVSGNPVGSKTTALVVVRM